MSFEAFLQKHFAADRLERVAPNPKHAQTLLNQAALHLKTAAATRDSDPSSAYVIAYDAARKALAAYLACQGLRATSRGGHQMVYLAVRKQVAPEHEPLVRQFDALRIRRNQVEYPADTTPPTRVDEVDEALARATELVELMHVLVPGLSPFEG